MGLILLSPVISLLAILLWSHPAFAWGPGTHLQIGWQILHNLNVIPPSLQALLESYPYDYLYGCISADIILGKKFTKALSHCHNWRIGFRIKSRARTPFQQAFAYGYLSHLAADTIAHNHFIPEKMIITYSTKFLRHIYWEMRFDAHTDRVVWDLPYDIMKDIHKENDPLLEEVLTSTIFSFKTNKKIFNHILLIHRMEQWHKMIGRLSNNSRWILNQKEVEEYYKQSINAVIDVLNNERKASCIREDPAGRKSLIRAKKIRKILKIRKLMGLPVDVSTVIADEISYPTKKIRENRA